MSIQEGVEASEDGGISLTGQGIIAYRFLQLKSAMQMQLSHGIYVGKGIRPFNIAVEELGIEGEFDDEDRILNKQEVYDATCALTTQQGVDKLEAYSAAKAAKPKTERKVRVGTANADERVFDVIDGYFQVTQEAVLNLLFCAFEGGSNYWYMNIDHEEPSDPSMVPSAWAEFSHLACPWGDGSVTICDIEEYYGNDESVKGLETWKLNEESIIKGLDVFAREYKKAFAEFALNDNYDGDTGDVFLQCCLFGRVVYG